VKVSTNEANKTDSSRSSRESDKSTKKKLSEFAVQDPRSWETSPAGSYSRQSFSTVYSNLLAASASTHDFAHVGTGVFCSVHRKPLQRLIHLRPFRVLIYRGAFHCRWCDFVSPRATADYARLVQLFRRGRDVGMKLTMPSRPSHWQRIRHFLFRYAAIVRERFSFTFAARTSPTADKIFLAEWIRALFIARWKWPFAMVHLIVLITRFYRRTFLRH